MIEQPQSVESLVLVGCHQLRGCIFEYFIHPVVLNCDFEWSSSFSYNDHIDFNSILFFLWSLFNFRDDLYVSVYIVIYYVYYFFFKPGNSFWIYAKNKHV